jgi:hypothetical protein
MHVSHDYHITKLLHLFVIVSLLLSTVPLPLHARPAPRPAHSPQPCNPRWHLPTR